jgi:cytochrome c-type biogenesis protein CcmE
MKIFLSLLAIFIVIAAVLVFTATQSTASSVLSPSQLFIANKDHQRVRIAGRVTSDAIEYKTEPKIILKFRVHDPENPNSATIPIVYEELKPDMFAAGRDVLIDGNYENGVLVATNLLTQCPSKYEPPKPGQ